MQNQKSFVTLVIILIVTVCSRASIMQSQTPGHRIEYGIFAQGGFPPAYVTNFGQIAIAYRLQIYSAGFHAGITTRRIDNLAALNGRGEVMSEIIPFWLAHYPAQTVKEVSEPANIVVIQNHWIGEDIHGVNITPLILRWNFSKNDSQRVKPWLQIGCGVLWTNHEFPVYLANTSVFNFTPQVGAGVDIFRNPKHSVNLGFKFIHISNGGLGDFNPAIHDSLNFSAGYSWWR